MFYNLKKKNSKNLDEKIFIVTGFISLPVRKFYFNARASAGSFKIFS